MMVANDVPSASPHFVIIGLQKAGTQWLTALLDAHPEINCFPVLGEEKSGVGEGHFFDILARAEKGGGKSLRLFKKKHYGYFAELAGIFGRVSVEEFMRLALGRYREWCELQRTKRLIGEKTVEYVFYLDFIDCLAPGMKKICLLRDPKDRIVSFYFHERRMGHPAPPVINGEFTERYLERVKREYEALLNYGGDIHCLSYEDLMAKPEKAIASILDYIGAASTPEIISAMRDRANLKRYAAIERIASVGNHRLRLLLLRLLAPFGHRVSHAAAHKVVAAIYRFRSRLADLMPHPASASGRSHYRKGVVGDHQNHLASAEIAMVDEVVRPYHDRLSAKYGLTFVHRG